MPKLFNSTSSSGRGNTGYDIMRPRHPIRKILPSRSLRPPNHPRPFTHNTLSRSRPQLPFLSTPSRRPPLARFLTTERRHWIQHEVSQALKYTGYLWVVACLGLAVAFGAQQEWLERRFPSPAGWNWVTRQNYRSARWNEDHEEEGGSTAGPGPVDWARTGGAYRDLADRLEDRNKDGAGLQTQDGVPGLDITGMSEPWRRGYYDVLMGAARASEHLDDWVRDTTRNIAFPASVVIGPSNPNPRPVPPGAKAAPREEDCEPAFDGPDACYEKIFTTKGFTEKQMVDAALSYASWLDFARSPEDAKRMYNKALDIVASSSKDPPIDRPSGILKRGKLLPSANLLAAATALAVHHATNDELATALPIFISILRARKSLSTPPRTAPLPEKSPSIFERALSVLKTPPHPPAPDDGTTPPARTSAERCDEAVIMNYIGEILYASNSTSTGRQEGLAWTREAVDIAEEELVGRKALDRDGDKVCRRCLEVSLSNWATMVATLAREERTKKERDLRGGGSWLGFGSTPQVDVMGRWESEEQVVRERTRRAREVLGDKSV